MSEPTNPKKRSLMGAGKLRKALRAAGHHLQPIVQVGKEGVTAAVLAQLSEALDHHELVKVRVGTESPEDRFEVADRFQAEGNAQVAQVIGRVILAYRQHATTPRFEPLRGPPVERMREEAPAPSKRRPGASGARASTRTRKPAPSSTREEFWQRKVAAEGRSRPEGGRRIWTEKPPRKEIAKGPAGTAKELLGRRSPKEAAGDRRRPPPGKPRGPRKEAAGDRRRPPPGKPRGPRKGPPRGPRSAPSGGRPGGRPPRGR